MSGLRYKVSWSPRVISYSPPSVLLSVLYYAPGTFNNCASDAFRNILSAVDLTQKLEAVGVGQFENADASTKQIWMFLGTIVYPKLSKAYKNVAEKAEIELNVDSLKKAIHQSDEALCLLILDAKIEEMIVWIDNDRRMRQEEEERRQREEPVPKRRRTRPKKADVTRRDNKSGDLVDRKADYNKYINQVNRMRKNVSDENQTGGDSWYQAIVMELKKTKALLSTTEEGQLLEENASQNAMGQTDDIVMFDEDIPAVDSQQTSVVGV